MTPLVHAILATLVISAISLVGVIFLFTDWNERRAMLFISFGAGVLLATAFLELLPEAVALHTGDGNFFIASLGAMGAFFVLERFLRGFHSHDEEHGHGDRDDSHTVPSGYLVLVGDTLHNFIDGVVIAAAFLVSPTVGVATTLAVAAHEIPQEVADFGILLGAGFRRSSALLLNFLSGLAALLGALWCFWFEGMVAGHLAWFMAATAGMFIYIAASDLMPELHHSRTRREWIYAVPFFVGVGLIAAIGGLIHGTH
ncbi:MAG: ZIP family metal transporter [Candidatus Binatia bacterium]